MDIVMQVFNYIEYFEKKFGVTFEEGNKYYSLVKNIQKYANENEINLSADERKDVESFIYALEIPLLKANVFKMCNPNIELIIGETDVDEYNLSKFSDAQLIEYMMYVFSTVTMNEHNGLVQIKYNIIIWNTGFHKFARLARGKIFDMETKEIVSYPFDKFFNVNEVEDTKEEVVKTLLKNNRYLYVTDKKDGSTIIVSKYKGQPLITTNGSFDNEQIDWAKKIFAKKYTKFLSELEDGFTYIFELIHPENRIVIDYGDEQALYMLAIRNIETCELLSLDKIHSIADYFGFPYPEVFSFNKLDDIIYLAHNMKGANKEGWVLRIGATDGHEYMLKIKLDEYFEMHSAFDRIKLSFVYRHLIDNDLDDFIAIANEEQKKKIDEKLVTIQAIREKIKEDTIDFANKYLAKHELSIANYDADRDKMIILINDMLSAKNMFKALAVQYIKRNGDIDYQIARLKISHMKKYSAMYGYNYNE